MLKLSAVLITVLFALATTCSAQSAAAAVPDDRSLSAYLFVFFKDVDHSLYFATSRDGYTFTAVNGGRPVIDGAMLAEQRGIRDPHITRGPDGAFYMVMTDLHLTGQRAGFRTTRWERPEQQFGWGNNRAIVMMRSTDLIHWSHADFRIDQAFESMRDVGCIWAPETTYDDEAKRLMVYFTLRLGNGKTKLYYSYADPTFTRLATPPVELFKYPPGNQILDPDITKVGDRYHLFYVAQGNGGGIKQAVSDHVNRGYAFDPKTYDPERVGREAPNVWRRLGTDRYVLMVDVFGVNPSNFGFSETTDFQTFTDLGHFNEGVMKTTNFTSPKHGAVIGITRAEATTLESHWK